MRNAVADAAYYRIGWVNMETRAESGREQPAPGATPAATATPAPTPVGRDYDTNDDGLIEIASLAQLDVIRHDLDGEGVFAHAGHAATFPDAMAEMGCLDGCSGYELDANLDFDTDSSGGPGAGDAHWNDGAGWLLVGDPETRFRYNAVFDGNGRMIANLFIRWPEADHIGLFRVAGEDADIRNVRLPGSEYPARIRSAGWWVAMAAASPAAAGLGGWPVTAAGTCPAAALRPRRPATEATWAV